MKKLLLITVLCLFASTPCFAAPFLTCDPMTDVDAFVLELDGTEQPASPAVSGRAWIDMAPVSMGDHTVRLKARNIWGDGEYSDPLELRKQLPGKPSGVGLQAE